MRSNGPLANKEVAIGGHGWPWVARSSGVAESGRLVRRMSHRVDPAAIAEEARTVRLDAVLGPPRRSVPVGDSSTPESRTLTPLIMVRIQSPGIISQCVRIRDIPGADRASQNRVTACTLARVITRRSQRGPLDSPCGRFLLSRSSRVGVHALIEKFCDERINLAPGSLRQMNFCWCLQTSFFQ